MPVDALVVLAGPLGYAGGALVAWRAPGLVRIRSATYRRTLAALSAVLAGTANVGPTGLEPVDVLMAAALGALVVVLGFRAKPATVTVAAVVAAVAAWDSPVHAVALAAVGLALATTFTARRGPTVTALVSVALVQVALRLEWPEPHGATALAAAAILVPVAYSGARRLRRTDRRRFLAGASVVAGTFVLFALLGGFALAEARAGLERGVTESTAGLAAAHAADRTEAGEHFATAANSFTSASGTLERPWARPALMVPILGQHLRTSRAVASTGAELSRAGERVIRAAGLEGVEITGGVVPLDAVRSLEEPLDDAIEELSTTRARLEADRSPWLWPSVGGRIDGQLARLADSEATARSTRRAIGVLPGLLGADGPRHWFLAVETPVEARASGGFIGNYGEIKADGGALSLTRFGRIRELNEGGDLSAKTLTGPADYVARYSRFAPARTWQNVTMSPDFPSVAQVIAELYPQSGGRPVDGVIAVDPSGLAALLEVTGPITIAEWPDPITAANAERILLYEQYLALEGPGRVDFLGAAAEATWQKLTTMTLPDPGVLVDALAPAVGAKHLMVASTRPGDEAATLVDLGIAGAMPPVEDDFVGIVTQNAGANKIDWFLRRRLDYTVDTTGDRVEATVRIALENTAPGAGLTGYLLGSSYDDLPAGTNRLYLSVYSPWELAGASVNGGEATFESEDELGRNVYSTFVDVPPGATTVIELKLAGVHTGPYSALTVYRQPMAAPDAVAVTVDGVDQRFRLDGDRRLRF